MFLACHFLTNHTIYCIQGLGPKLFLHNNLRLWTGAQIPHLTAQGPTTAPSERRLLRPATAPSSARTRLETTGTLCALLRTRLRTTSALLYLGGLQYGDHARLLARVIQRASRASFAQRRQQDSSAETSTKGALQPLPAWPSSRFNITLMCFLAHMA